MKHKLESRFPGEISITSDTQMTPPLWQKAKKNFPGGSDGKASVYNVGDLGSILGLGSSLEKEMATPLQYSCLGNPMDRGAWWAAVHGVAKS